MSEPAANILSFISFRFDTYPYFLLASSYILLGFLLVFIPPLSTYRKPSFILFIAYAACTFFYADTEQIGIDGRLFFGHCTIGILLYGNYFLCGIKLSPVIRTSVRCVELAPDVEAGLPGIELSFWEKSKWAYQTMANPRGIGTSWQVRNLPVFSRKDSKWIPSRSRFLITQAFTFVGFYVVGELYAKSQSFIPWEAEDFSVSKIKFFRRLEEVTLRELVVRLYLVVNTFLPQYFLYRAIHSLVAGFSVLFGGSPSDWPPLFGDLRDAYSMRGFWGKFWHLLYYKGFMANAAVISHDILCIPKKTQIYRCVLITVVFGLSAIVHITGDKAMSLTCKAVPLCWWYLIQSQVMVAEILSELIFNHITKDWETSALRSGRWKILGHLWVIIVFAWSIPKMQFPNAGCSWKAA